MVPYTTGLQRANGPSLWKNPLRHLWVCTTVVVCLLLLLSYWLCCHVRSTSYLRCSICFWVLIYSSRRCFDKPSWSWLMHSSFIHFLCVLYFCYFTGTVVVSKFKLLALIEVINLSICTTRLCLIRKWSQMYLKCNLSSNFKTILTQFSRYLSR